MHFQPLPALWHRHLVFQGFRRECLLLFWRICKVRIYTGESKGSDLSKTSSLNQSCCGRISLLDDTVAHG